MTDDAASAPASPASHLHWAAEALWQQLEPHLPGISVEVLARAESTNTLLLERARLGGGRHDAPITTPGELEALRQRGARDDLPQGGPYGRRSGDTQPCLLVAEHQTLGRGRLGRGWLSAPGASLTFSIGLPLAPPDWSGLSLAVGVALADAIEPPEPGSAAPRIGLKWPNDLWLVEGAGTGRKLGGVLIETVAVGGRRMVVVGVGLNISPLGTATSLAAGSPTMTHGHACVQEIVPAASAPSVLHTVALPLVRALLQFEREGFAGFASAYERRDLLRGHRVAAVDTGHPDATPSAPPPPGGAASLQPGCLQPLSWATDMLRWLVLALLLANALFWAWSQGWLSPLFGPAPGAQREPWRLQQQLRPESVRVLPPGAAPPAAASSGASGAGMPASAATAGAASAPGTTLACFESPPLTPATLDAAEQALATVLPARGWIRASREASPQHVVVLGPLAREALQKKRDELTRLKLGFEELRLPGDAGAGLALGRYESPSAAQAALEGFGQRGVRTARVVALREAGSETRLRIENATPAQAEALRALKTPALGAQGLVPCAAPAAGSR
jgi:BirA family biotin operon repressor/biotin-[acetyl-CoA-carboxylase] ligase